MESNRAFIGAILLIVMVVFSNLIMYGIVRGLTRGGKKDPLANMLKQFTQGPKAKGQDEFEELNQKVQSLKKEKPE